MTETLTDGRNRHRGCLDTGTEPRFRPYEGDDPLGFVVSANLQRRHLSASQRAVLALTFEAEYAVQAKEHQGTRTDLTSRQTCLKVEAIHAAEKAASVVGVSGRLVRDAKRLQREAPDRLAGVLAGGRSIHDALADGRLDRKHAAVAAIAALPAVPLESLGPFPVLYADPPWRYKHANPSRAIENHYPTMELQDIKALDVPACDNAVLFLWAPSPMLEEAFEVMAAWRFRYRTCMVWVKPSFGTGYYVRQQHELLLIGDRGDLRCPDPEDRPSSVVMAPRAGHSVKPVEFYEVVERMYPLLERVELFARQTRPGWSAWGNEVSL